MNFFTVFFVSFFLIVTLMVFFGEIILSGWGLIAFLALILALCISGYLRISDRIDRIEQYLGLAPEEPEETMTITERWEMERAQQEAAESENS